MLIFHVFVFLTVLTPHIDHVTGDISTVLLTVSGKCIWLIPSSWIFSGKTFVFRATSATFSILPIIIFSCSICRPDQLFTIFSAWLSPSVLIHFPFCSICICTSV